MARAPARRLVPLLAALLLVLGRAPLGAQTAPDPGALRLEAGRLTVLASPQDVPLARSLLRTAARRDSFPGLARPRARALILVAPDDERFRAWSGPHAPHWGAAVAIPALQRIVLRGGRAAAAAGDPHVVLRHELAHLALHEALGDLPPRWFDEGYASYAAGEWGRDELLTANLSLLYRRMPRLDSLDRRFLRGEGEAASAYALSHRAVAELAALDGERGLTLFFRYWGETGAMDAAVRRAYGVTLGDFEKRWQQRTRRRYGVLAVLAEMSVGAGFALLVVLPLLVLRRRRDRERWAELRAADARAALLAAESAASGTPEDGAGEPADSEPVPAAVDAGAAGAPSEEADTGGTEPGAAPSKGAQPFA